MHIPNAHSQQVNTSFPDKFNRLVGIRQPGFVFGDAQAVFRTRQPAKLCLNQNILGVGQPGNMPGKNQILFVFKMGAICHNRVEPGL